MLTHLSSTWLLILFEFALKWCFCISITVRFCISIRPELRCIYHRISIWMRAFKSSGCSEEWKPYRMYGGKETCCWRKGKQFQNMMNKKWTKISEHLSFYGRFRMNSNCAVKCDTFTSISIGCDFVSFVVCHQFSSSHKLFLLVLPWFRRRLLKEIVQMSCN